ncbi:hydrolyase, tartrate beta subunit/fumarate domain protein, Fe-S type [Peptacetobacter hiranonis DSM 13275]|uniref:Hydrolyase, tartrate beta subunit/fumarate domain protein, Fe-S type n=2 Tax=Peptacetobacter TaxID=2743582 RepID=B6FWA1_PEPHT|nr:Fe-S-containing hydro-lyase [Peptacetobacter hiranonis]EEA86228.1 hydrolyase, tartrate beta subunit/fumarate domain protein, Fe-S type [Peptacetobacter hiranonis DSM 13275]QEK21307.1 NAD-dependent malic enzyme [Peptacetobacter hiranonis]
MKKLVMPVSTEDILDLKVGEMVELRGVIYTGRDAAHKRFINAIENGEELPFNPEGQGIYYVGPTPSKPGEVIGSAGPTTSYRMDDLTVPLLERGLKVMIGKGKRSEKVVEGMKKYKAVYLAAIGGAGAYISDSIKECEVIAYDDLGAEAVRKLKVENLKLTVAIDSEGNNIYEEGRNKFMKKDFSALSLELHEKNRGKVQMSSKIAVKDRDDLSIAYTPGVAAPCVKIHENPDDVYKYTLKGNMVAIVSDGSAVLGLGDIGASAGIPVMEGKAILFKEFAGVEAFPICLDTNDVDDIVRTVKNIAPVFGGINLEDISAPRCFEIERRLKEELDIPVFHDDQHGTAIVVSAAIINATKLIEGKNIEDLEVVINGAGSAGIAIAKMLLNMNVKNVILCDRFGAITEDYEGINEAQLEMARVTNKNKEKGLLKDVIKGKDVFVGVSRPGMLTKEMVKTMGDKPVIMAMANPTPEIMPDEAKEGGAFIVGTGRSDFPNQINNVLAFPGIFRGALDVRATDINEEMKVAAAYAIANSVSENELNTENILPMAFDKNVAKNVAEAVKKAAIKSGVVRK